MRKILYICYCESQHFFAFRIWLDCIYASSFSGILLIYALQNWKKKKSCHVSNERFNFICLFFQVFLCWFKFDSLLCIESHWINNPFINSVMWIRIDFIWIRNHKIWWIRILVKKITKLISTHPLKGKKKNIFISLPKS